MSHINRTQVITQPTEALCAIVFSTNPAGRLAQHREWAVQELTAHRFIHWFDGHVHEFPRECVPDAFKNHPRVRQALAEGAE